MTILKTAFSIDPSVFNTYELGVLNHDNISKLKNKTDAYFKSLLPFHIENIEDFISTNKEKIIANEYKDNLSILFAIIKLKYMVDMEFVGFSLPTTFNKHKNIFEELKKVTSNNSIKLN